MPPRAPQSERGRQISGKLVSVYIGCPIAETIHETMDQLPAGLTNKSDAAPIAGNDESKTAI